MLVQAPKALIKPIELISHQDKRIDNYYWLRERENPEVIEYLNSENIHTNQSTESYKELIDDIFDEIVKRIKKNDNSVPFQKDGYFYQTQYKDNKEYPIIRRWNSEFGEDYNEPAVLLDVNLIAEDYEYFQISNYSVSPNQKYLAYSADTISRRLFTIYIQNLETGKLTSQTISNTSGELIWSKDSKGIIFIEKDPETLRSFAVKFFELESLDGNPEELFTEKDETFYLSIGESMSGEYCVIQSESTMTSEVNIWKLDASESVQCFLPRERGHEYNIDHLNGEFYVKSNAAGKNFDLNTTDKCGSKENWMNIIPHNENRLLESFIVFDWGFAISWREMGQTGLSIQRASDHVELKFDEASYVVGLGNNLDPSLDYLRLSYTSLTTPTSIYDYSINTQIYTLKKQEFIEGGFYSDDYQSEKIWITARDGVKVPVSLVYRKDKFISGQNPLLLYGYGSYGISIDPSFGSARISLLDRGFVYAIAHVRGGEDMGRYWYEEGRQLKKMNTFHDFIDCAKHLIENRYCHESLCCAMGGSAGGLLMGAVINMEPTLWKAVVAAVPFVDVVTTMLDDSIPLTTGEYDEWGDPNDPIYYNYIKQYSPVDNIKNASYPALLVTTGLHDSQVQYWEPAKWIAKLRTHQQGNNSLLLYTDMTTGHGGASGRFARYRDLALEYAFLIHECGVE